MKASAAEDGTPGQGSAAGWLAASAALAAAALIFSPGFVVRYLSADHHIGAYVVARLQAVRLAAAAGAAACLAWPAAPRSLRERLPGASLRLLGSPGFAAAAFILGFLLLLTEFLIPESEPCAEGLLTYGALRVAHGSVPARDFFTYVFPGGFYYLAAAYKLFGATLVTARAAANLVPKFLCFAAYYGLSRMLVPAPAALGTAVYGLLVLTPNPDNAQIYNGSLSMLFGVLTLPLLLRSLRGGRAGLRLAGLCAGLSACVRQDFGAYAFAAGTGWLALMGLWGEPDAFRDRGRLGPLMDYLVPWALTVGTMGALMVRAVPLPDLRECYLRGVGAYMANVSSRGVGLVPVLVEAVRHGAPSVASLATGFVLKDIPLALLACAVGLGTWVVLRSPRPLRREEASLALLVLWCAAFTAHVYKGSASPMSGSGPVSVLVLAVLLRRLGPAPLSSARGAAFALATALLVGHGALRLFFRPFRAPAESAWAETPAGRYLCPSAREAEDLEAALRHVRAVTRESDRIFVLDGAMTNNDTMFYFLSGRDVAGRYQEFALGQARDPAANERAVRDIEGPGGAARVVELEHEPLPPNAVTDAPAVRHVRENFRVEARFGRYVVWTRK